MKLHIICKDENDFTVFIHSDSLKKEDFFDKEKLENYFQDFFLNFKKKYNFNVNGFYLIDIYLDEIYGAVIDMTKEDVDYFDYFNSSIDMQISKPKKVKFLYKIQDLFMIDKKILKKMVLYHYQDYYYLQPISNINSHELAVLLEFTDIIYSEESNCVLKFGKLVKLEV